jgi:hypothetical protein
MRCASTSVSVSETKVWPRCWSIFRSADAFSMIPLCTTAIVPVQSWCGCALHSFGGPCVAQRVCAIPTVPCTGLPFTTVSSIEIFPAALRVSSPFPFCTEIPAES